MAGCLYLMGQSRGYTMKDHHIAAMVNELTNVAIQYQGTQQLREHIRITTLKYLKYPEYEEKCSKVNHHPKCAFMYVEFAKCDCGEYKGEL